MNSRKLLIKLGGTLLDTPDSRLRLARHGGGKQMTRFLAERGVESRFVNGLRVTTPEVIDAVLKVFAGSVNAELVTAFRAAGAQPVGLSGLDAGLVDADLLNPELGQVGQPVRHAGEADRVAVGRPRGIEDLVEIPNWNLTFLAASRQRKDRPSRST